MVRNSLNSFLNTNEAATLGLKAYVARYINNDNFISERLAEYQLYWKFYENKHWAKNNSKLLSFNWVAAIIDKVNRYTLGKGFETNIEDLYGEPVEERFETAYEALINYTWRRNKKFVKAAELFQMGAICGSAYVFIYPNLIKKYVEIDVLDSRYVVPVFKEGQYKDIIAYKYVTVLLKNKKEYLQKIAIYSKGYVVTYYTKEVNGEKFEEHRVKTGLPFIPIVMIENSVNSASFGGFSDARDILQLNKVYNEMAEDVKEVIDYYVAPVTVVTGGYIGDLKRGLGQVWSGLPTGASVSTLGLNEDLGSTLNFMQLIRESMHDLTGVPQEVLSKVQHVSNTSAASLKILYYSLTMAADNRVLTYTPGIEEINRNILMYNLIFFPEHYLVRKLGAVTKNPTDLVNRYIATPVYSYGLPYDRMNTLQELNVELNIGAVSRRTAMERLAVKNIPKELKQIKEDDFEKSKEFVNKATEQ